MKIIEYLKQPMEEDKILKYIVIIMIMIVISSLSFDLGITMYSKTIYKDFHSLEQNKLFVWGDINNFPILLNPSVFLQILTIGLFYDTYLIYTKNKNLISGGIFLALFFSNIFLIIGHFIGGFSWIWTY